LEPVKKVVKAANTCHIYYISDTNLAIGNFEKFVKCEFQNTLKFLLPEVCKYSTLSGLGRVLLGG